MGFLSMFFRQSLFISRIVFILLIAFAGSVSAQQSVSGTLSLSNGFATSDMNIVVEVASLDENNVTIELFSETVTIAANTGSVSYQIGGITGDRFALRYLCADNTCGRFVREIYVTQQNTDAFDFTNDTVLSNNQLPPVRNFNLRVGNTVSGTIFLPRAVSDRELMIFPVIQFIPNQGPNVAIRTFFDPEFQVPEGATQIDFTIEGVTPIDGFRLFPFSFCQNCEPELSQLGLPQGVSLNEDGILDVQQQIDNSVPSNQNHTGVQLFHILGEGGDTGSLIPSILIPPILNLLLLND